MKRDHPFAVVDAAPTVWPCYGQQLVQKFTRISFNTLQPVLVQRQHAIQVATGLIVPSGQKVTSLRRLLVTYRLIIWSVIERLILASMFTVAPCVPWLVMSLSSVPQSRWEGLAMQAA